MKPLPISGSLRKYYRFPHNETSYIYAYNESVEENESFFYLTEIFHSARINVPEIYQIHPDRKQYIQEDLGNQTLLNLQLENPENTKPIYIETVKALAHLQLNCTDKIDYTKCVDYSQFSQMVVLRDLFYFKDFFLDALDIYYRQEDLLNDFEKLSQFIKKVHYQGFMVRDCQGRNVMIKNNQPYFIDYQGGMKGSIAYDLASLLWQAKAQLNSEMKGKLFQIYSEEVGLILGRNFSLIQFKNEYEYAVLIRLLQVLGAYGKLGLIQQKPHFLESIQYGIQNLKQIINSEIWNNYPTLHKVVKAILLKEITINE